MKCLIGTLTRMSGAGIGLVDLEGDKIHLLWADTRLKDPNWLTMGSTDGFSPSPAISMVK